MLIIIKILKLASSLNPARKWGTAKFLIKFACGVQTNSDPILVGIDTETYIIRSVDLNLGIVRYDDIGSTTQLA